VLGDRRSEASASHWGWSYDRLNNVDLLTTVGQENIQDQITKYELATAENRNIITESPNLSDWYNDCSNEIYYLGRRIVF
jgi:hypothetical protein